MYQVIKMKISTKNMKYIVQYMWKKNVYEELKW